MHLKEDLSVVAQRIEGYKIEGLSEEIDKVNIDTMLEQCLLFK